MDEPTGETTGEDWLERLELTELDAVDDGVKAGGV